MTEPAFQLFGTTIPPLVGRGAQLRQIVNELSKQSPSHISIVGPKFSGKSVLLKSVCNRMAEGNSPFSSVVFWDLAHLTPSSDEEFIRGFCREIAEAIKGDKREYADLLHDAEYSDLKEIVEELAGENYRILMAWDGFDKPLRSGQFSRNLWDQLRELASQPSLRLVTATRRPLQELIRNEESVTSDFWNIFGVPVKLGPFDEQDVDDIASSCGISLEKGARTQLAADSGLFPPLALAIVNSLDRLEAAAPPTSQHVAAASEKALADQQALLADIWGDCDQPTRELFYDLDKGDIPLGDAALALREALLQRGLAVPKSGKLQRTCRLMGQYVATQQLDRGTLNRQFGVAESYASNMHSVLELRLAQLNGIDARLKRQVEQCLEYLPEEPDSSLKQMRNVCDRAFNIMLARELGADFAIPLEWKHEWQQFEYTRGNPPTWFQNDRCPHEQSDRLTLLGLIVRPRRIAPKAKHISREALELAQAVKQFGDWGQHMAEREVSYTTALAAVNISIELAHVLSI